MTFAAYETSRSDGNIIQFYLFRYGTEAGEYFAYTDHTEERTVAHGGSLGNITYTPVPIERAEIIADGTLDRSDVGINMDIGTDLAELFRVYPPSNVVTLTIYAAHIGDGDDEAVAIWAGRIVSAGRKGSQLVAQGEPVTTQMLRLGLRRHYQYGCPLVLYSEGVGQCNADKAAATVTGTVASISGASITLDSGWEGAFAQAKFLRGMVEWTPTGQSVERRSIIRVTGDTLSLSGIPKDLAVSDSVDIILGCNHQAFGPTGDCQALHDNIVNYGGDPWIPLDKATNRNVYY